MAVFKRQRCQLLAVVLLSVSMQMICLKLSYISTALLTQQRVYVSLQMT